MSRTGITNDRELLAVKRKCNRMNAWLEKMRRATPTFSKTPGFDRWACSSTGQELEELLADIAEYEAALAARKGEYDGS